MRLVVYGVWLLPVYHGRYIGVSPFASLLWRECADRTPELVPHTLEGLFLGLPIHEQDGVYEDRSYTEQLRHSNQFIPSRPRSCE